jgi:hypothetical protein
MEQLPTNVNAKSHWSGKQSFAEAVKSLRGELTYAVFYRHTSTFAHGADFADHVQYDEATDEVQFKLLPSDDHIVGQARESRAILWAAAQRINDRLGLNFDAILDPHRPIHWL